ncbi:hypothetical protein AVDCRST_MAG81-2449, partial [uncultured Synechococcales cyanobacterium]
SFGRCGLLKCRLWNQTRLKFPVTSSTPGLTCCATQP